MLTNCQAPLLKKRLTREHSFNKYLMSIYYVLIKEMSNIILSTPSPKHTLGEKARAWEEDCVKSPGATEVSAEVWGGEDESKALIWVQRPSRNWGLLAPAIKRDVKRKLFLNKDTSSFISGYLLLLKTSVLSPHK